MELDLSGTWRATLGNEELRRAYQDDGFDDDGWSPITVPGHWQRSPDFAHNEAPLLYRHRFETPEAAGEIEGTRHWLTFDGVFYQSDVWLDGTYLGDTEGYFFAHTFEVTDALAARSEHVLAVDVSCAPHRKGRQRSITGVFQHGDLIDRAQHPTVNPGGIWRPVRISSTGPIAIRYDRVTCVSANSKQGTLRVRAVLHSPTDRTVTVRSGIAGVTSNAEHAIATGENQLEWDIVVDRPELWWPHSLGGQPLYDLELEVVDSDGRVSDRRRWRVGFREVRMTNWVMAVNGERLFTKGTNLAPTDYWLADTTAADHRRDLQLARDANLDLVRVHGHISVPDLYDTADEAGMLVWQDLPLQPGHHRSLRKQVARQAREAVDLLGHHPSIAVWCANNKSFIDRTAARSLGNADPSRPVLKNSTTRPRVTRWGEADGHLYLGWLRGDERQLPATLRAVPRLARFVSEFGAPSVPADLVPDATDASFSPASAYGEHIAGCFDEHTNAAGFESPDDWAKATRNYQAMVIRFHVEALRRLKYRPTGGFAQFFLADPLAAVSGSIVSHMRVTKEGYRALADACRPVIAVADRLPVHLHGGEALALDVHVINDLRTAVTGARLQATLAWADGEQRYGWAGDVAADSVQRISTIQMIVPEVDGPLVLDLELHLGDEIIASSYRSDIYATAHDH